MRERLQVLSMIYRDRVVGIRRIKNESLSTRRGLRMSTKKRRDFIEDAKEEVSGNRIFRD